MESSSSLLTLLVISLITIGLVKLLTVTYNRYFFWKKRGIPYIAAIPVLGSGWKIILRITSFPEYCKRVYNLNPNVRYIGLMDFTSPVVLVRDPELIKDIAVKNFEHFTDHRAFVDETIDPLFGKNVFSLRGDRWKEMRSTLSPSFTATKMRFMFELVSKCAHDFTEYLVNHPEFSSSIEVKDAFTRYTNDVIATAAFGITVNSLEDRENEFYIRGKDATTFGSILQTLKFLCIRLFPKLSKLIGLSLFSNETSQFFKHVVSETVRVRDEQGISRPDMIHLLMQARNQDKLATNQMTIDDITAQAFIFFLAGFDTSSTLMCFMIHELAINPDIQEKLRKEVDMYMAAGEGTITYEALSKMEYMDMVVSETLRKYPPVVIIDRVCVKKFELPPTNSGGKSVEIEPDIMVWFPVYALHNDPRYFPNPEKFDPERFSEKNKDNIVPYTYLPFGIGPRKCIGNRFALMETKILMAHLLHRFNLKVTEKTRNPIKFTKVSFSIQAEGGFWIGLEKRS